MFGIPSGLKSERNIRGTLKEASEKNNALRRLKPRFEAKIVQHNIPSLVSQTFNSSVEIPLDAFINSFVDFATNPASCSDNVEELQQKFNSKLSQILLLTEDLSELPQRYGDN
ncbi:hypothetical protein AVEN_1803-1 [Araneus ventricosus]|uniref:Uncharacterized protein n=1 Tax=Araneus ventricosus TaxID=182803 RepID=A0A4Y2HXB1_ARAVE|nr:hypothetical protein AVEN_1803-1 [Araneus ventricosus]